MKKYFSYFIKIFPVALVIIFIALEFFSRSAAAIFNKVVAEQKMLKGTVTVEKIYANIFGEVDFENLLWKDTRGNTLVNIPEGSFKVSLLDIITNNFKASTIQELTLNGASISLRLNEKMEVDFVGQSPDFKKVDQEMKSKSDAWAKKVNRESKSEEELKKLGERRRKIQQEKIEKNWQNFNLEGNKINLNLALNDCRIEIFYRDRHYLLSGVNFETKIDTADKMTLNARTGIFGGTMSGRGLRINGTIDFKPKVPQCDLSVLFFEVDPSSLGFGMNVHDAMTLSAHFSGDISRPIGTGIVKMNELHIPGLDFYKVAGNIFYEDSILKFTDVTAEVYEGDLTAYGDYNLDTRYYNIYGHGKNLKTYAALPNSHLHCNVDLDITINSKGNARETSTSGSFSSSKGRYSVFKIDKISGKFKTEYNSINFYDVAIDVWNLKVSTDALSIVDKKLKLNPIKITDENGNILMTFTRD